MLLQSTTTVIGAATAIGTAIIGVYVWVGKHISNNKRHTSSDELVFEDVCTERGKANEAAHNHLKEGIENAIKRSDQQHIELKDDMRTGFSEIKSLIKNGRQ